LTWYTSFSTSEFLPLQNSRGGGGNETLYRISLGLGVKIADLFQAVQVPS
jgi:hypothetical protein